MSDMIEVGGGDTIYRIYGLHARGSELASMARALIDQLDQRGHAAHAALVGFRSRFRRTGPPDARSAGGVVPGGAGAATICLQFPDRDSGTYPPTPQLSDPPRVGALSGDAQVLRAYARHTPEWDAFARQAGQSVNLDGVHAEEIRRRWTESLDPPVAMWVEDPPTTIDPAKLVALPPADRITAQTLSLSQATSELAVCTADALEVADAFGPEGWEAHIRLQEHIHRIQSFGGHRSPNAYADRLRDFWLQRAIDRVDLDFDGWDPNLGIAANRPIVEHAFGYYGAVYAPSTRTCTGRAWLPSSPRRSTRPSTTS